MVPGLSLAAAGSDNRLVVVILRGGMDGLAAVPPVGDPDYQRQRQGLAIDGALPLQGPFALHPALPRLHGMYGAGELAVVHAVATPYRGRSHFDGQDLLESGAVAARDGWLNRALAATVGAGVGGGEPGGIALAQAMPLILRGDAAVTSWAPTVLPAGDDDTVNRILDLYRDDAVLGPALSQALATRDMAAGALDAKDMRRMSGPRGGGNRRRFVTLAKAAGRFLADDMGVAVLDYGGWDTHAGQGAAEGDLARTLAGLDEGLGALADGLGPMWRRTAVVVITEFGRTVAINGTGGTDHGTASAALLLGGAVSGGRVIADWPGLKREALYDFRDLMPTTDLRAVLKGVLRDHLAVDDGALARVFPDSDGVAAMDGLVRA